MPDIDNRTQSIVSIIGLFFTFIGGIVLVVMYFNSEISDLKLKNQSIEVILNEKVKTIDFLLSKNDKIFDLISQTEKCNIKLDYNSQKMLNFTSKLDNIERKINEGTSSFSTIRR